MCKAIITIVSVLFFQITALQNVAFAQDECAKMLIPKVSSFSSSMERFVAYINAINMAKQTQDNTGLGIGYAGVSLDWTDAQAASSFYQQQTNYTLAESDTVSITSSELPQSIAKDFVDCVTGQKQDIKIFAPAGADNQLAFQITVVWTPTYPLMW